MQMQNNEPNLSQTLTNSVGAVSLRLGELTTHAIASGDNERLQLLHGIQSAVVQSAKRLRDALNAWNDILEKIPAVEATPEAPAAEETPSERRSPQGLSVTIRWAPLAIATVPDTVIKNNIAKDGYLAALEKLAAVLPPEQFRSLNLIRIGRTTVLSDNPQRDFPSRTGETRSNTQIGTTGIFALTDSATAAKAEYLCAIGAALAPGQTPIEAMPIERD